jgi:hypothetical protein
MLRKIVYVLVGSAWLAGATAAFSQDASSDVRVKLSLADNKTSFRTGDPIRLILEFTAESCEACPIRRCQRLMRRCWSKYGGSVHQREAMMSLI